MSDQACYAVYVLFDRLGQPFYVGVSYRPFRRFREHSQGHKDRFYAPVLIAEDLTKAAAISIEAAWIAALGRHPNGPLLNIAAEESRGRSLTPEHRAKLSQARLGHRPSTETREKMANAKRGTAATLETRAKMSASRTGHITSTATKDLLRAKMLEPATRAKLQEAGRNSQRAQRKALDRE